MKYLKYIGLSLAVLPLLCSCHDEDTLSPSEEALFPGREMTPVTRELDRMFSRYNVRVEYRYIRNLLPDDWYYIQPAKEDLVIPVAQVFLDMWIGPLIAGSDTSFVEDHFPRQIVLVGSPALQLDGSRVMGQAEGGTLIRFTEINEYRSSDVNWINEQMTTAFHEYAHILHQTFNMPDAFREVTPDDYTLNGWMALRSPQAIIKGMVTPYGTSSVQEDFAEIFSSYVLQNDSLVDILFHGDTIVPTYQKDMTEEQKKAAQQTAEKMMQGCVKIAQKFKILKNHLLSAGLDVEKVRQNYQERINAIKKQDD